MFWESKNVYFSKLLLNWCRDDFRPHSENWGLEYLIWLCSLRQLTNPHGFSCWGLIDCFQPPEGLVISCFQSAGNNSCNKRVIVLWNNWTASDVWMSLDSLKTVSSDPHKKQSTGVLCDSEFWNYSSSELLCFFKAKILRLIRICEYLASPLSFCLMVSL